MTCAMMSSCFVGSFAAFKACTKFNNTLTGNKIVNAIVAYVLFPFETSIGLGLIDCVFLNTIEFWTGSNPLAESVTVKASDDALYAVAPSQDGGYTITNKGTNAELNLVFDEYSKTWSAECAGVSQKLMTMVDENNAIVYYEGRPMNVELSQEGVEAWMMAVK